MLGLILGMDTLVVGVEDDEETGGLRMYVGARWKGIYAIVEDEDAKKDLRNAWAGSYCGHLTVPIPPRDVLFTDEERP